MDSPTDFTLPKAAWDQAIFDNAVLFTVITVHGRGKRDRLEFDNPQKAFDAAKGMQRTGVYAVSKEGRSVMLQEKDWPSFSLQWKMLRGLLMPRKKSARE